MLNQSFFPALIVITVVLNTLAQALLKLGAGRSPLNLYLLGGVAAYGFSTLFYITVLGKFNLSVAYPVIIGFTVVTATVLGAYLFHEKISHSHWIGIGLILSGLLAIAASKH
jgi:multidrug transporter EmrE-like cation transporter